MKHKPFTNLRHAVICGIQNIVNDDVLLSQPSEKLIKDDFVILRLYSRDVLHQNKRRLYFFDNTQKLEQQFLAFFDGLLDIFGILPREVLTGRATSKQVYIVLVYSGSRQDVCALYLTNISLFSAAQNIHFG
ncbi:hypothetical protein SDC9_154229 [bioreactor metagenome]|uniref:Uncharacterized protein n=1 Tax=bioreactor metagenome TaxID=1076179 RepID=A0A645F0F0_9ZZZZ